MFAAAWLMVMFLLVAFSLLTAWRVSKGSACWPINLCRTLISGTVSRKRDSDHGDQACDTIPRRKWVIRTLSR